jgi:tetratricopeptide (TPR) repeat protein
MSGAATVNKRRFAAFIAALSLCACAAIGAHGSVRHDESREIRDPHYGEVLFHFYQQQYFSAITNLMTSRQFQRISHHGDEAELLLGGMYLSYGLHRQAGEIFQRLIDTGAPPPIRDRAWFYLAKIRYQRGYRDEAEQAISRVRDALPGELEEERQLLQAQLLMERREYRAAAQVLARMRGESVWAQYGRYNLGVALIKAGEGDAGAALLEEVGRKAVTGEELKSLRDKANVALGYAYLRDGVPARAQARLEQVRLDGLLSNKALLGMG